MTDIEAKALALVNEVQADWNYQLGSLAFNRDRDAFCEALCRAIEQHEAFKQEVSDAVKDLANDNPVHLAEYLAIRFSTLIGPKPKPDPLVDVLADTFGASLVNVEDFRAALEARGLEIREKGK